MGLFYNAAEPSRGDEQLDGKEWLENFTEITR